MVWKVRPRGRKQKGKMNKWEGAYADRLEMFRLEGSVIEWKYEPLRFMLAPNTTYTPDFMIITTSTIEFHEVKGQRYAAGMAKFKIAAALYPWAVWRMVEQTKQGWHTVIEG